MVKNVGKLTDSNWSNTHLLSVISSAELKKKNNDALVPTIRFCKEIIGIFSPFFNATITQQLQQPMGDGGNLICPGHAHMQKPVFHVLFVPSPYLLSSHTIDLFMGKTV